MKQTTDKEVNAFPEYPKDILRTSDFNKLKAENEKLVQDVKFLRDALNNALQGLQNFNFYETDTSYITSAKQALEQTK